MDGAFRELLATVEGWEATLEAQVALHFAWSADAIFSAFAVVNSVRLLAYLPQIMRASRDQNGAAAISCITWGLFLASHLTTIAYAVVCAADLWMAAIFLGNALACTAIIVVTLAKRRMHVPAAAASRPPVTPAAAGQSPR